MPWVRIPSPALVETILHILLLTIGDNFMFSPSKSVAVILLAIILSGCAFCAEANVNLNDPCVVNKLIGRGVNIGNSLEAPKEGDWDVTLQEEYFQLRLQSP